MCTRWRLWHTLNDARRDPEVAKRERHARNRADRADVAAKYALPPRPPPRDFRAEELARSKLPDGPEPSLPRQPYENTLYDELSHADPIADLFSDAAEVAPDD